METIKFRGQRIDTKEWVYGDLIQYATDEILILPQFNRDWDVIEAGYKVIPETVGQFIGLRDKSGIDIYNGDKVIGDWHWTTPHVFEYPDDVYNLIECGLEGENLKVIGNIHDK